MLLFVFVVITRTMAFKILVEVNTGYYLGFIIALGKYDAEVLVFGRIPFERVGGTRPAGGFTFPVVDFTVLENVFHFRPGNVPAFHSAFRMLGVLEVTHPAIKPIVAVGVVGFRMGPARVVIIDRRRPATLYNQGEDDHGSEEQVRKSFFHVTVYSVRNYGSRNQCKCCSE